MAIDTSNVDQFRQGIELTQAKYWDAGLAKIWAGEAGHVYTMMNFGQGNLIEEGDEYFESDSFDPIAYIEQQHLNDPRTLKLRDVDQRDSFTLDGTIEPIALRTSVTEYDDEATRPRNIISAELMGGVDTYDRSSRIIDNVYDFNPLGRSNSFCDDISWFGTTQTSHSHIGVNMKPIVKSFNDSQKRIIENGSGSDSEAQILANSLASSRDDGAVSRGSVMVSSGFVFDTGTVDSIAFGGMTY